MLWKLTAMLGLILVSAVPVLSQDQPAIPFGIPTPPGATVSMEVNMSRDQIIGQAALLAMGSGGALNIGPEELTEALGGLQAVQYAEMKLSGAFQPEDVIAMFQKEVGGRRVLYDVGGSPASATLLMATEGGGYFGAVITSDLDKSSGKVTSGRVKAARLYGFPDVRKTAKLVMPLIMQMGLKVPGVTIGK